MYVSRIASDTLVTLHYHFGFFTILSQAVLDTATDHLCACSKQRLQNVPGFKHELQQPAQLMSWTSCVWNMRFRVLTLPCIVH